MLYGLAFCAVSLAIVWGTTLERIKFGAYVIYAIVFGAVIYPLVAHAVWGGGLLSDIGGKPVMDFAGSSVVHLTGAVGALAALLLLGPRIGKYDAAGKPRAIPGHSMPLVGLGVIILWIGWFGFNGGSTFETGGLLLRRGDAEHPARRRRRRDRRLDRGLPEEQGARRRHGRQRRDRRPGRRSPPRPASSSTGRRRSSASSPASSSSSPCWRSTSCVDDPVGALSAHGLAGIWGTLAVGIFASPRLISEGAGSGIWYGIFGDASLSSAFGQLGVQALAVAVHLRGRVRDLDRHLRLHQGDDRAPRPGRGGGRRPRHQLARHVRVPGGVHPAAGVLDRPAGLAIGGTDAGARSPRK